MIKVLKNKFVWFPEVNEKVIIRKKYLPPLFKDLNSPVYGKILLIDGEYLIIKYKNSNVINEHYRNEIMPFGDYKQKKKKK